jgi:hypothetical protein
VYSRGTGRDREQIQRRAEDRISNGYSRPLRCLGGNCPRCVKARASQFSVSISPMDAYLGNAADFRIADMSGRSMCTHVELLCSLLYQLQNGVAVVVFG